MAGIIIKSKKKSDPFFNWKWKYLFPWVYRPRLAKFAGVRTITTTIAGKAYKNRSLLFKFEPSTIFCEPGIEIGIADYINLTSVHYENWPVSCDVIIWTCRQKKPCIDFYEWQSQATYADRMKLIA